MGRAGPGRPVPAGGRARASCLRPPGGGKSGGGGAPSSWRRRCRARGRRSPPPSSSVLSSPPLPSHPAARLGMRKILENEKGGGRDSCALPGEGTIASSPPRRLKDLEWATGPECSRPALGSARPALQPQPRVCRMWHPGEGEPSGMRSAGPRLGASAEPAHSLPWVVTVHRRVRTCSPAVYGLAVKVTASN